MEFIDRNTDSDWQQRQQQQRQFNSCFMPIVFDRDGKAHPKQHTPKAEAQDFYALRKRCLDIGILFEDPQFPANSASLPFSGATRSDVEWLRPNQICKDPKFSVKSCTRFDVNQGELQDCWLLAAAASLTQDPHLFSRVVPVDDNSFTKDYVGICHFRFWRYGHWYDVVIDDLLPTVGGKLIYMRCMRSTESNEFWSALLEKAYAKLFGSYEALIGGSASEAMVDFTGGIAEAYELNTAPQNLFQIIEKGFKNRAMFVCSLFSCSDKVEIAQGLIKGHAYSLTMVRTIDLNTPIIDGKVELLRLRNPWGNANEWNGAWSDESAEWDRLPELKQEIGLTVKEDGEFWMSYGDFVKYFDYIEICNLSPNCPIVRRAGEYPWWQSAFEGEWVRGNTAGGCCLDTIYKNPQYLVHLDGSDKDDDQGKATAVITLMQKNRRFKQNNDLLTIGFIIYRVTENDLFQKPLPKEFFLKNKHVETSTYRAVREVTCRFRLEPGIYVLIPSTSQPKLEGKFMVRVFSEYPDCMSENEDSVGECDPDLQIMMIMDILDPTNQNPKRTTMWRNFHDVAGEDGEVDATELKMLLDRSFHDYSVETNGPGFSKEACRSMVAMLDQDKSGKLGFVEFQTLLVEIDRWKEVFKLYDPDHSGYLDSEKLRAALKSTGYSLSNKIINSMLHRYSSKEDLIRFDDFISCAVKVKIMIEIFCTKDWNGNNVASFSMNEWIHATMYS